MLSELQQNKLAYFFSLLDLNRNDLLQHNDFSDMAEQVRVKLDLEEGSAEHKYVAEKSIRLFHQLLSDISPKEHQSIRKDEWLSFFESEFSDPVNEDVLETYQELIYLYVFDFFDHNRDGFITKDEYKWFFEIFKLDEGYLDKSFSKLDSNGDSKVSRYEMLAAIEDFLISSDSDSAGNWAFGNWTVSPK
ncbi:MAG: EF-hand domain-containing protein [Cyclobacteriaceae bacterium]